MTNLVELSKQIQNKPSEHRADYLRVFNLYCWLSRDEIQPFKRFYRVDPARSQRGFGLGLPIAQRIMELHGGTISLKPLKPSGIHAQLRLPLQSTESNNQ